MKKLLFIVSVIALTFTLQGQEKMGSTSHKRGCSHKQDPRLSQQMRESKFQEIVKVMQLDKEKAEIFLSIYSPFEREMEQVFIAKRKAKEYSKDLTEEEAKNILDAIILAERKQADLLEKYDKDLSRIFTAKERLQISKIERDIHKKIIMEVKKREHDEKNSKQLKRP